jgi:DNA replication and repair protein RecF
VHVGALQTLGFRNLAAGRLRFGEGITLLWGPNGAGKTNVLEAVCLALTGRSTRTRTEREAITFGEPLTRVEAEVADGADSHAFLWSLDRSGDRRHLVDENPAGAEHAELRPPLAIFQPDRLALVKGPPAVRRALAGQGRGPPPLRPRARPAERAPGADPLGHRVGRFAERLGARAGGGWA